MSTDAPLDAEQYAADLLRRAESMYADAHARSEALAAASTSADHGDVHVRVSPGGVLEEFTVAEGASPNPVRLSDEAGRAYDAALRGLTSTIAQHSGGLDATILAFSPAADDDSEASRAPAAPADAGHTDAPVGLPADEAFESLLAVLDESPDDLERFVSHPEFQRLRPGGDPAQWQQELEQDVAAISAHAGELAEAAARIVGVQDTPHFTIEVGPSGRLIRLVFKNAIRSVTPDRIGPLVLDAYAEARHDAEEQLAAVRGDLGIRSETAHDDGSLQ